MKKILSLVLTIAMLATMCVFTSVSASAANEQWDGKAATSFSGGGDGSSGNPYKIATAGELKLFANIVNGLELADTEFTQNKAACAVLTADIVLNVGDLNGYNGTSTNNWIEWSPIGYYSASNKSPYTGIFNGEGHTVSGLYFNNTNQGHIGLFGRIDSGATISNLGVLNSYIAASYDVGGVSGQNYNGGKIENCYNTGTIIGNNDVGGVCGGNISRGTIVGCYNTGKIVGADYDVGGVCGANDRSSIRGCYNTGSVSGKQVVGGVVGTNPDSTITGCYNIGTVSGTGQVGGVSGDIQGSIDNSYYLDSCAAAGTNLDCSYDGIPKTAAQMKTQEFTALLNTNGGSFVFYGGYPSLNWEPNPNEHGTNITYSVAPTYTVTIPEDVTLGGTVEVKAENVILDEGKQLEVALTATSGTDNAFTVSNGNTATLTYEVTNNSANVISIGGNVLTVNPSIGDSGSVILNFSKPADSAIIYSGDYSGTVTFTVSVAD